MTTHSFSSIKDFQGCRRRYYYVRVLKAFKQSDTAATLYGTEVHKAIEDFFLYGTALPEKLHQMVSPLKMDFGTCLVEHRIGMTRSFVPCAFDAPEVWIRGIPDYLHLHEEKQLARVADWKTGKSARYADSSQLELMAALIMQHFPWVQRVKAALVFLVAGSVIPSEYAREQLPDILAKWAGLASDIEEVIDLNVWNATPSGLCRFCPVSSKECEHKYG